MPSLENDDDILVIEEPSLTSTMKRSSSLRVPVDASGPSNSVPPCENESGIPKLMRLGSYERLSQVEEVINS
ncbi:hypothetical protein GCK32_017212, partial [Trichostrongylus colubriformis]